MNKDWKMDPVLLLLFVGLVLFTGILIWVEHAFQSDGQIFQCIASVLAGFTGSFFTRLNPKGDKADENVVSKSTLTVEEKEVKGDTNGKQKEV